MTGMITPAMPVLVLVLQVLYVPVPSVLAILAVIAVMKKRMMIMRRDWLLLFLGQQKQLLWKEEAVVWSGTWAGAQVWVRDRVWIWA